MSTKVDKMIKGVQKTLNKAGETFEFEIEGNTVALKGARLGGKIQFAGNPGLKVGDSLRSKVTQVQYKVTAIEPIVLDDSIVSTSYTVKSDTA